MGETSQSAEDRRRVRVEDLRLAAPLAQWSAASLERLAAASSQRWHEPGEILARAWEPPRSLVILLDGCIELTRSAASGKRYLSDLLAPPQVAGLVALLDGRDNLFDTRVRVRSLVITCPRQRFLDELTADPANAMGVLKAMCLRQRMEHDRFFMNAMDPVVPRVCKTIMYLARRPGPPDKGGRPLPVPVTYEDLADFLGQSQSSVVRVVKTLIEAGALEKHYRGVVIADAARLAAIAQDPHPINPVARDYLAKGERV